MIPTIAATVYITGLLSLYKSTAQKPLKLKPKWLDQTKYAQLNDLNMYYYDNEKYDKPAVVLIHGLGENINSWSYQIKSFNANYRVIAMDLRGHGLTNGGINNISMEQFAADIMNLLDYLNVMSAHFIGISLGGMICQELTKTNQKRMLSVTLSNTAAFSTKDGGDIPLHARLYIMKYTSMGNIAEYCTKMSLGKNSKVELYNEVYDIFSQNSHEPLIAATAVAFTIDFRSILAEIQIPTLIIACELDQLTPIWHSEYLNKHIDGSKLIVFPGIGHLSKLENPVKFNKEVMAHIDAAAIN